MLCHPHRQRPALAGRVWAKPVQPRQINIIPLPALLGGVFFLKTSAKEVNERSPVPPAKVWPSSQSGMHADLLRKSSTACIPD